MLRNIFTPSWQAQVRPGDIVLFNLPQKNPTRFGKAVLYCQKIVNVNNRKTHAAMVIDAGDTRPEPGEMALKVIDIEFGRKASAYFIPYQYGDIDIYRLFNSQQSYTSPEGNAITASSDEIASRATAFALSYVGASYSVRECWQALSIHKAKQEHIITSSYLNWLNQVNKDSSFMCVSFVVSCYQKACLELLGGLPKAFEINAHSTPRYFAEHLEKSGHFTKLPTQVIREILSTATPAHEVPRFTWFYRLSGKQRDVTPLLDYLKHRDSLEEDYENDDGAGMKI